MEPKIVDKGQIILIGFSFFGDPFRTNAGWTEENEIGRLWNRFITYLAKNRKQIKNIKNDMVGYELHMISEDTPIKGIYEVFVGLEVEKLEDVPADVLIKILPPTKYAVFTLQGKQITSDWSKLIFSEWMPGSGYQKSYEYGFQLYDQRFHGLDQLDESVIDVYVPIKRVD